MWILHLWKNSFFQASSESIACAFYQLPTSYQSIRFQLLPVQKYEWNINCNISKYFSPHSFFIFSRHRWLLTSVISKWVYIRKNLYKQTFSKLYFSVVYFTNFRRASILSWRNFLHLDYASTGYCGGRSVVTIIVKSQQNTDIRNYWSQCDFII